jgi:hypothetical protein
VCCESQCSQQSHRHSPVLSGDSSMLRRAPHPVTERCWGCSGAAATVAAAVRALLPSHAAAEPIGTRDDDEHPGAEGGTAEAAAAAPVSDLFLSLLEAYRRRHRNSALPQMDSCDDLSRLQ